LDWKWGDGENFGGILNISTTFSVHSPMRILAINAKESEFVDHDTKWWNTGLLKVIFIEDGVMTICKLQLSCHNQLNDMIWRENTTCKFIVCCAYHMEKKDRTC